MKKTLKTSGKGHNLFVLSLKATIIGVLLNLLLPLVLSPLATEEERNPEGGPTSLSFKGQFMHMMVHHNHTKVVSSLIVALIVYLSVLIAKLF